MIGLIFNISIDETVFGITVHWFRKEYRKSEGNNSHEGSVTSSGSNYIRHTSFRRGNTREKIETRRG